MNTWQPGQSGNPAGRKPGSGKQPRYRALLEEYIDEAVQMLIRKVLDAQGNGPGFAHGR